MKKFWAIFLAAIMVVSMFAVVGCDDFGKDDIVDDEIVEEDIPEAVGKWELCESEDEATLYLKIDEDGDVAGEFVTLMQDAIGVDCDFSYDFEDETFDIEYEGITISIDCYADGDFLIIDPEKISEGSDPMILRRVGTDGDPVEYYYDNFEDDDWEFDYTGIGGDDDDDDDDDNGEVIGIDYTAPDGFAYSDDQSSATYDLYCREEYLEGDSSDSSNINTIEGTNTYEFNQDEEYFETAYEKALGVDLTIDDFDRTERGGLEALRVEFSYTYKGVDVLQVQYLIKYGEKVNIYTYTQFGDADWFDDFEDSIADIEPIYE